MQWFKSDLHIHTVLSPCGDLDMSPVRIVNRALETGVHMLAITDHNSTGHCRLIAELGLRHGIAIIPGTEVTTMEEIHCLALFENLHTTDQFQQFIDKTLTKVLNKPQYFGQQLMVDEEENILYEEKMLLIVALNAGIDEVEKKVHELGGLFIPAHFNRPLNSMISQLGYIPQHLQIDALEVTQPPFHSDTLKDNLNYTMIRSSDAHNLHQLGKNGTLLYLEKPTFKELKMALHNEHGRKVMIA